MDILQHLASVQDQHRNRGFYLGILRGHTVNHPCPPPALARHTHTHTQVWGAPKQMNPAAAKAFIQHLLYTRHTVAATLAGEAARDLGKLLNLPEPWLPQLEDRNKITASQSCRQGLG